MVNLKHKLRIPPEKLRRTCRPEEIKFTTSAEARPLAGFIGQERAVRAMQFGLLMNAPGYNIYVAGPPGTGKSTYVQAMLQQAATGQESPPDWCYVYNFQNPDQPVAISLPPGEGSEFQKSMEELLEDLRTTIPRAFEGNDYEQKKQNIIRQAEAEMEQAIDELRQKARDQGFSLKQGHSGFVFVPLKEDGKPLSSDEFESLPLETKKEMEKKVRALQSELEQIMQEGHALEKKTRERIRELDKQIGLATAGPLVERLRTRYENYPSIQHYLQQLLEDVIKNLEVFRNPEILSGSNLPGMGSEGQSFFNRYRVNLFVSNSGTQGKPVVIEPSPHYYNLFGKIEYRSHMGTLSTDFTMIKAGAVHRANGGYLVLQARDILSDPIAWDTLKRALKNRLALVENIGEQYRMVPTVSLRPEPIPLQLKVILIGSHTLYHLLYALDEDFEKFFKVKVDFDTEMPRTPENIEHYCAFVSAVCQRENLKHFDRSGLAELVEYGSRLAGSQKKLSTRFNRVVEIVYEAAAWAESEGAPLVNAQHVRRAIEERIYRSNRIEEKIFELLKENKIMIDTEGAVIGQVNGLSVIELGDYTFGRPSRITAKTFMGSEGVVNIEREVKMSGTIHAKGVLTLVGFLGEKFAQDKPLRLSARITFEQLYEGIEGDSASSAELYALLSSLAEVPVDQNLAVTGSVNQHGQIQPVGGVTEKIEGFYALCKARGLNGCQGVIIPAANLDDLMLHHEIVQATKEGLFHIYAIHSIDEGIELLTGIPAGQRQADGTYPPGTIYHLVDRKLRAYALGLKQFSSENTSSLTALSCDAACTGENSDNT